MARYRSFGSVRQLPSGRWQVRYREPATNRLVPAAATFVTKREATNWLAAAETDMVRGAWVDPRAGRVDFTTFATAWLRDHPNLRARTRENYAGNLRNHILPVIGALPLNQLSPNVVRRWHAQLSRGGQLSPSTVAKCYRLVHAILETAVADELIVKNPCLVRGAAQDRSAERPIATLTEVLGLAEAVPPRYRALILTATFTGLRFGELLALRREDIDLLRRTVNVEQQLYELSDGTQHLGPPKTTAGRRVVALPPPLVPELERHLETWTGPTRGALVFTSPEGGPIRRGNFRSRVWLPAARRAGLERLRFHDLRHTGNTLAAATGASTRELMARMGHASPRAALIYQHATSERDHAIAAALGDMLASAAPAPSAPVHRIRKSR